MEQFSPKIRNQFSKSAFFISAYFNETPLSKAATAFFYSDNGKLFLITTRHNVTGRNNQTGKCLRSDCGVPNLLHCDVRFREGDAFALKSVKIPLFKDEDVHASPLWLEHPDGTPNYDVIAIPTEDEEKLVSSFHQPVNEVQGSQLPLSPGDDCFMIGFPKGKFSDKQLPIWKRGSIASEPGFNVEGQPMFYVDTAADHGLSGAPVIAKYSGFWNDEAPYDTSTVSGTSSIGVGYQFVGIYSGRYGIDINEAQLGLVYRSSVVDEICKNGLTPQNPHLSTC